MLSGGVEICEKGLCLLGCARFRGVPICSHHAKSRRAMHLCRRRPTEGIRVLDHHLAAILTLFLQILTPRYNARIRFLQAQITILRSRIPAGRIVPTPRERAELLRLGAASVTA